jgi:hypothetical protein
LKQEHALEREQDVEKLIRTLRCVQDSGNTRYGSSCKIKDKSGNKISRCMTTVKRTLSLII